MGSVVTHDEDFAVGLGASVYAISSLKPMRPGLRNRSDSGVLAWGDERFGSGETFCLIHPGNSASIRVALKCGYREMTESTYKGQPTLIFVR